jgi:hypothetical protein
MLRIHQASVAAKSSPRETGYRKNQDGSVDVIRILCPFSDACKLASEEGLLRRPDGRTRCGALGEASCQILRLVTSREWDYELLVAYAPHCIVRLHML